MSEHELARQAVERAAANIRSEAGRGGRLKLTTAILSGSPKSAIVEEAERWGADLIVVGSHGSQSWEQMLLGSVSQRVATHAKCPVEVVSRENRI
jgi:nucleotide-binding universal stress UspA family protein